LNQIERSDAILQTGQVGKRGGSWNDNPRNCRSAYRNYNTPDNRNNNIGFRVVCSAPSTLHYQNWQVGYLLGASRRVQTCSGDASASKNQTEPGSLVSFAEELSGSNILFRGSTAWQNWSSVENVNKLTTLLRSWENCSVWT